MSMNQFQQEREARARLRAREEALAASLTPYPRDGRSALFEKKLNDRHDELMTGLDSLDRVLDEVADEFAEAFAREDARAAVRDRIAAASPSIRNQAERALRRG